MLTENCDKTRIYTYLDTSLVIISIKMFVCKGVFHLVGLSNVSVSYKTY